MYNNQSKEATNELLKQTTMLSESDYANYLAAFGSMKTEILNRLKNPLIIPIAKNPKKNINYKRLKAEIYAQSSNRKEGLEIP